MDSDFYYISCKGQKKGPFKFYQLQQLRTEARVSPADFYPREWDEFIRFIDSRGNSDTTFISKLGAAKDKAKPRPRPFLKWLTYASYALAVVFIIGGLIHGEKDYILRSRPMFWLGLIFAVALSFTVINRLTHSRASGPASRGLPLVWLVCGLLPLLSMATLTAAMAHLIFPDAEQREIIATGVKYLCAAALVGFYRPFYLQSIAANTELPPLPSHSPAWISALAVAPLLAAIFIVGGQWKATKVSSLHKQVFAVRSTPRQGVDLPWEFTVRPGDMAQQALKVLGNPQEVIGREYIYRGLGVQLFLDAEEKIKKFQFVSDPQCALYKTPIIGGVTPEMDLPTVQRLIRTPPSTVTSDNTTETYVWNVSSYQISGCFWKQDTEQKGRTYKQHSPKWLEITVTN